MPNGSVHSPAPSSRTDASTSAPPTVGATRHAPLHRPFGRKMVDRMTNVIGTPLHKFSPLFGHAYDDGIALRTIIGNAYFLVVALGAVLGALAVKDTHGLAIPPVLWLTLTITALGILDAFTGFVATVVFTAGVVFSGHLFSSHWVVGPPGTQGMLYAFTGILSMAFFWFIGPQLPRRIRLLGFNTIKNQFQRRYVMVGDFFVVTLLMILILGSLPVFVPIFTGADKQSLTQVVLQNHIVVIKWVVGIAAFLRVGLDEIVHANFQSLPKSVGRSRKPTTRFVLRVCASLIALALIWEVLGTVWQWPVVWVLLISLDGLTAIGERFLKPSSIYRFVPRYLFRIVTLLLFTEYAARLISGRVVTGEELVGWLVLLLVIVISVYSILDGPDDLEDKERPATWWTRLIGIIVVIALFVLSQDIYSIPATPYSNPAAVAVSSSGMLYIADSGNNRVIQVAPDQHRAAIGSGLSNPTGVAVDTAPNSTAVFVSNTGTNQVLEVETVPGATLPSNRFGHGVSGETGLTQQSIGSGFLNPTGLATDAEGRLFIADTGHNRIEEILPSGQQITFASNLSGPLAVATDAFGQLFVTDTGLGEVLRYQVGANGADDGSTVVARGLSRPAGVAADAQGNFYVSNTGENTVYEYLANGKRSVVPGSFSSPRGLAVDGQGHLYIADTGHGQVILSEPVYAPSHVNVGPSSVATAAALAPNGTTYVVSSSTGDLEAVTSTGTRTLTTGLDLPSGVAWSAISRLYVSQAGNGTIEEVDPVTGGLTLFVHGLADVSSLTPDPYGGLYALQPSLGRVVAISAQGKVSVVLTGLTNPTSLVQDAYGYLDVVLRGTTGTNGAIWRIEQGGTVEVLAKNLHEPTDITADANGDVFFLESGTATVYEERGLLGRQIVYQGTSTATNPAVILADRAGNLTIFPQVPHRTIHLHRSSTDYPI